MATVRQIITMVLCVLIFVGLVFFSRRFSPHMLTIVYVNETGKPIVVYTDASIPDRDPHLSKSFVSPLGKPESVGIDLYGELPSQVRIRTAASTISLSKDGLAPLLRNSVLRVRVKADRIVPDTGLGLRRH